MTTQSYSNKNLRILASLGNSRRIVMMVLVAALLLSYAVAWRFVVPIAPDAPSRLSAIDSASKAAVIQLEERLTRNPDDPHAYAQLGHSLLQNVRESGDSSLYTRAGQAFGQSLKLDPHNLDALVGQGMLSAALHDFDAAIEWAEQARAINPWRADTLGILVDAFVELGRYEEAVAMTQEMVDLRPGLDSYSRVSYIRELHGDIAGAVDAMQTAVDAGVPGTEAVLWSQVQLGNLYLLSGDLAKAEEAFQDALNVRPSYLYARAGLARAHAEAGDYLLSAEILEDVTKQLPLPEFVLMLAEVYEATGELTAAEEQRDLVRVMQRLNESAGMNVDQELAMFEVEYGVDPQAALEIARAAYEARPTIFAADAMAWALFRNGELEEAKHYSDEALRLGTVVPKLLDHAKSIDQALASMASRAADTSSANTASTSSRR